MSDTAIRSELERTQAECKDLEGDLADFPATSSERAQLAVELRALEEKVATLERELDVAVERERAARDRLDELTGAAQRARGVWWMSRLAPVAVTAASIAAIYVANRSLDYFNWPLWAVRIGMGLLAIPLVVNGLRFVLALRRRSRSR